MKLFLVITSFSILQGLTEPLSTPDLQIKSAVKSGMDPHDFKLTARQAAEFKSAQAFILTGLSVDQEFEKMARRLNPTALFCNVSNGLSLISADPHIWQSPTLAIKMVQNISDCLDRLSPTSSSLRSKKKNDYVTQIEKLRDEYKKFFDGLKPVQKRFVTSHDAFAYLAKDFGLEIISVQGLSTETEPTPQTVANLIKKIKSEKIQTLFLEKNLPPHTLKRIASETNAKMGGELFSDSLSAEPEPAGSYIKLMQYNLKMLSSLDSTTEVKQTR